MQGTPDATRNHTISMSITLQKKLLIEAVGKVTKAISSKTTIPILTGIKLTSDAQGITLTGSNSDISIKTFIPAEQDENVYAEIQTPGSIVVPSRLFSELIRKLPEEDVHIEADSRLTATITSGAAEYNLNGMDAEEYPSLPVIRETVSGKIKTALLKDLIHKTVYAVSDSETRPVLTGVRWSNRDNMLECVATDGHRLAQRSVPVQSFQEEDFSNIIIPGSSLKELAKILTDDNDDESIDLFITQNQILFRTQNVQFYSRLLNGKYPDTGALIPKDSKTSITLSTRALYAAIERASILAKEERNNVVKLKTEGDRLEITSQSPELGRLLETLSAEKIEGEDLRISFSAKFMMDALSRIDAEQIRISFTGPMSPFVIRPIGDNGILMLILPIRTYR